MTEAGSSLVVAVAMAEVFVCTSNMPGSGEVGIDQDRFMLSKRREGAMTELSVLGRLSRDEM